jgi:hypothetical protein
VIAFADFGVANLRIFPTIPESRISLEKQGTMWRFAFEFSAEFPASLAKFGFRENFPTEVLEESIRLVSAVRFQIVAQACSDLVVQRGSDLVRGQNSSVCF